MGTEDPMSGEQARAALAFDVAAVENRLALALKKLVVELGFYGSWLREVEQRLAQLEERAEVTEQKREGWVAWREEVDHRLFKPGGLAVEPLWAKLAGAHDALKELQAENERLRVKQLSQTANAHAREQRLETMVKRCVILAERNKRVEAELVSERKCRNAASQALDGAEWEIRQLRPKAAALAGAESEVRQLLEMNRGRLDRIEELEGQLSIDGDAFKSKDKLIDRLRSELAEAREKGLQLGNAALKQGWWDCEAAVVKLAHSLPVSDAPLTMLIRFLRAGAHRPEGFDPADRASGMGQDDGRVQAGQFLRKRPLPWTGADEIVEIDDDGSVHALPRDPFAYPAGLPEEDPGSAPGLEPPRGGKSSGMIGGLP